MARPRDPDSKVSVHVRVSPATQEMLVQRAADAGVATSELTRLWLGAGRRCEEHACAGWERAAERGRRNEELLDRVVALEGELELRPARPASEVRGLDPLAPPEPVPLIEVLDPRGWVPVAWRGLDDRALAGKGCCLEHRQMREACDAAQLHDEGV